MMVVKVVLSFLILATITEAAPAPSPAPSPGPSPAPAPAPAVEFDYMQLVQSWPPSTCDVKGCDSSAYPEIFTIHGLWPEKIGQNLANCGGEPFKECKIQSLIPEMRKYWMNIPSTYPVEWFWAHEWNLHGTCTNLDIFTYFDFTLKQYLKYDLIAVLEEKGITPGKSYSVKNISKAILAKTGFVPIVRCKDVATKGQVLFSVSLCYNNATVPQPQHCTDKPYRCDLRREALLVKKTPALQLSM